MEWKFLHGSNPFGSLGTNSMRLLANFTGSSTYDQQGNCTKEGPLKIIEDSKYAISSAAQLNTRLTDNSIKQLQKDDQVNNERYLKIYLSMANELTQGNLLTDAEKVQLNEAVIKYTPQGRFTSMFPKPAMNSIEMIDLSEGHKQNLANKKKHRR